MNIIIPILTVILYNIYVRENNKRNIIKTPRALLSFNTFILLLHNISLLIYSSFVSYSLGNFIRREYKRLELIDFLNDSEGSIYKFSEPFFYSFYISKYWELLETVINFYNGNKCTFLQSYHHTGAIISMFLINCSMSHIGYIFVLFNSTVHTIMYTYYLLVTLKIRIKFKYIITILQMVQFISGISLLIFYLYNVKLLSNNTVIRRIQKATVVYLISYVSGLYYLFYGFYKQRYLIK